MCYVKPLGVTGAVCLCPSLAASEAEEEVWPRRGCGPPVLEGAAKLVGIDRKLEAKVVSCSVREDLHHWVLTEHVATLEK